MVEQNIVDRLDKEVNVLNRHLEVFKQVWYDEPIGVAKLSIRTGQPHHKVRYSLRVLEERGLIEPGTEGATTTEQSQYFVETVNGDLEAVIDKLKEMKTAE